MEDLPSDKYYVEEDDAEDVHDGLVFLEAKRKSRKKQTELTVQTREEYFSTEASALNLEPRTNKSVKLILQEKRKSNENALYIKEEEMFHTWEEVYLRLCEMYEMNGSIFKIYKMQGGMLIVREVGKIVLGTPKQASTQRSDGG